MSVSLHISYSKLLNTFRVLDESNFGSYQLTVKSLYELNEFLTDG
jgi:hypothetical protein